ncbi:unnamed protein product [Absidia cylindrospora]
MVRSNNTTLGHAVSVINHDQIPVQFLILDCPTESTLPMYLAEFLQHHVTTVVRCCQPTYNADLLFDYGIDLLDLPFRDGGVPNDTILGEWIELISKYTTQPFYSSATATETTDDGLVTTKPTIAVHCVAGLGRAPVLVALALIELGMTPLDAISFIRQKRRGAFNKPQIHFLDLYKRSTKYRRFLGGNSNNRRSSSSTTMSSSASVFSWGGRMMLKLTHRTPSPSPTPTLQQQQQIV